MINDYVCVYQMFEYWYFGGTFLVICAETPSFLTLSMTCLLWVT